MKKIMIVDDSHVVRELVTATLGTDQYEIIEASKGAEAIIKAASEQPDLMLLDIEMPGGMSGYDVCEKLKSNPKTENITIIMLTSLGDKENKLKGLKAGADDYFVKPFNPLQLLNKIESVLE